MGNYESRLDGLLVVTDVCGTDRWMCSVNEYYELTYDDVYVNPFSSPTYTFLVRLLDYCIDDELGYDPRCDDDLLAKAVLLVVNQWERHLGISLDEVVVVGSCETNQ